MFEVVGFYRWPRGSETNPRPVGLSTGSFTVFPKTLFSDSLRSRRRELKTPSILIIGGGIVGLATARQLLRQHPGADVTVLEKEPAPGQHQTAHNSGVLHCGLYYTPGSLKARLAVEGIREMAEFCDEHKVPHEICGKLVVATNTAEVARMEKLFERGQANGLEGIEKLNRDQMREIEPHIGGLAALKVPQEGIVDYIAVIGALRQKHRKNRRKSHHQRPRHPFPRKRTMDRRNPRRRLLRRLDYQLRRPPLRPRQPARRPKARPPHRPLSRRIFPPQTRIAAPRPPSNLPRARSEFPFLGVHFTRLINGGIEAGPNAVLAFAREGYRKTNVNLRDLFDALTYSGLWRFAFKYPKMCVNELRGSFSKKYFCKQLQKLVPEIQPSDLESGGAGVRAQAMSPEGGPRAGFPFRPRHPRPARPQRPQPRRHRLPRHRHRNNQPT